MDMNKFDCFIGSTLTFKKHLECVGDDANPGRFDPDVDENTNLQNVDDEPSNQTVNVTVHGQQIISAVMIKQFQSILAFRSLLTINTPILESSLGLSNLRARIILGVGPNATHTEIRQAYRKKHFVTTQTRAATSTMLSSSWKSCTSLKRESMNSKNSWKVSSKEQTEQKRWFRHFQLLWV